MIPLRALFCYDIPITLEDARALTALAHPNHLLTVSSWGFARLPLSCISNSDGYIRRILPIL